eukprot:CAMPEP_0175104652 /NCGR_PEP_ID=MMETSP0086_2-20121207/9883_1 /TAXON_ID=136419 /ORGANISM="Unknown Unknown, Strain D1" /LENGTH=249 /DNA_ID=CAMNT_0016380141 /DNA_START=113 /DNA_END=862 /DNA_ORIENTATION=-
MDPYDKSRSLLVPNPDLSLELVTGHFSDPAILIGLGYLVLAVVVPKLFGSIGKDDLPFTAAECRGATWFLLNGGIIHVMMDGLTGGYGLSHGFLPLMFQNYQLLDNRCRENVAFSAGGPSPGAIPVAVLVFRLELYCMAPLCFFTYFAYALRKPWRAEMAVITLVFQILGTVFFVGPELMTGCPNVSPFGPDTGCFSSVDPTSLYDLMYFYFAFGMNFVWIIVPVLMIYFSVKESSDLKASKNASKKNQ